MGDFLDLTTNAPAAVETEDGNVKKDTANTTDRINKDVADLGRTTKDGKLVYFVNCAVDDTEDHRISYLSVGWESGWMKAFDEARK